MGTLIIVWSVLGLAGLLGWLVQIFIYNKERKLLEEQRQEAKAIAQNQNTTTNDRIVNELLSETIQARADLLQARRFHFWLSLGGTVLAIGAVFLTFTILLMTADKIVLNWQFGLSGAAVGLVALGASWTLYSHATKATLNYFVHYEEIRYRESIKTHLCCLDALLKDKRIEDEKYIDFVLSLKDKLPSRDTMKLILARDIAKSISTDAIKLAKKFTKPKKE